MDNIEHDVKKLMNLDDKIKEELEDENAVIKSIVTELISGLKQVKAILNQTDFENIGEKNAEDVLGPAKNTIDSFIQEIKALEQLDARFENIKNHAKMLERSLSALKNSLSVYVSSDKAITDFNNNVLYIFKTTIHRDFEHDVEFNKRIEESLG